MIKRCIATLLIGSMMLGLVACNYVDDTKSEASETAGNIRSGIGSVVDGSKNKASTVVSDVKTGAESAADSAKDKATEIKDGANNLIDNAKDKASDIADNAKDKASDIADNAKDKASDIADNVKDGADSAADNTKDFFVNTKDDAISWYSNLDFSKFKDGWDKSSEFISAHYSSVVSSEYINNIQTQIEVLKTDINGVAGSARGTAQEAGYMAEKWTADTFNIDAAGKGSSESGWIVGSNEFGSADVDTSYGEKASLKYYQTANESAQAQAMDLLTRYYEYCSKSDNPVDFNAYIEKIGYDPELMDELLASNTAVYDGQTRIIPSDQLGEAKLYLQGKIDAAELSGESSTVYKETLDNLKDRLESPNGVQSTPLTREEAKAIAELAKEGEFKPEDFGIAVSAYISPKYVVKQAIGTGLTTAVLNTAFEVGPDIYSVIREAIITGGIDEDQLEEIGLEAAISASEGFVEGSVSSVVVTLCKSGVFGEALKGADPSVVATITIVLIEGAIEGYRLSQGQITPEEYGNLMADRILIGLLSVGTIKLMIAVCAMIKMPAIIGCLAGAMIASIGYMYAKEALLEMVDGGGFEAILPQDKVSTFCVAKETIASLNISEKASNFGDSIISTANDGLIKVKGIFDD